MIKKLGSILRRFVGDVNVDLNIKPEVVPLQWMGVELPRQPWSPDAKQEIYKHIVKSGNAEINTMELASLKACYEEIVRIFPHFLLEASDLDPACRLYNLAYILLWRHTLEIKNLKRFNEDIVRPFSDFIKAHCETTELRVRAREVPRIAILCNSAQLDGSDAIARITVSLLLGLTEISTEDGFPKFYLIGNVQKSMVSFLKQHGLSRRIIRGNTPIEIANAVKEQCIKDKIDILITDSCLSVNTLIFETRAAPVQVFHEAGFAAWAIRELDFLLLGVTRSGKGYVARHTRFARTPRNTAAVFQAQPRAPEDIERFREKILSAVSVENPRVIYGFYGRLTKVSPEYVDCIRSILLDCPDTVFIIGGTGPEELALGLDTDPKVGDRVVFIHDFVDGHVVAHCIDVFLDTFPFPGGVSCIEVQARGVPVVWMSGSSTHGFAITDEQRDAKLRATNRSAYIKRAAMLADRDQRRTFSASAKRVADRYGDVVGQARQVHRHLMTLWCKKRRGRWSI